MSTDKKKLDHFPIGNKIMMGKFIQDARMFLVRGDECVEISYGDFADNDLSKIEVNSCVRKMLGEGYVYESGRVVFGTSILTLPVGAEILVVSGNSYLTMYRQGYIYHGTCHVLNVREWAWTSWKKS